jgi:hypothetical protein
MCVLLSGIMKCTHHRNIWLSASRLESYVGARIEDCFMSARKARRRSRLGAFSVRN